MAGGLAFSFTNIMRDHSSELSQTNGCDAIAYDAQNEITIKGDFNLHASDNCVYNGDQKITSYAECNVQGSIDSIKKQIDNIQNKSDNSFSPLAISAAVTNVDDTISDFMSQINTCNEQEMKTLYRNKLTKEGDVNITCQDNAVINEFNQEMNLTAKCMMDVAMKLDRQYELETDNSATNRHILDAGLIGPIVIAVIAVAAIGLLGVMLKKGGRRRPGMRRPGYDGY